MKLIYYRDKNGKILRYHLPPKDMTSEQLESEMDKFNELGDVKVYSQEIEEESLEMHLYEMAQMQRRFPKEAIKAALDAIDEARDAITSLEAED